MSGNGHSPPLLAEERDGILLLTLNRPQARNAVDRALAEAMALALDHLEQSQELRVAVLSGNPPGFCAGMDLKAFAAGGERPVGGERGFAGIVRRPPSKPIIAAIEGFAVAGGLEIALACDLIVAARDARLALPEVSRGLVAAGGALLRLPRRLPYGVAAEMVLTGAPLPPERAFALGLVNRLVEPGEAQSTALELAERIAAAAPLALTASKRVLEHSQDWPGEEFWARQAEIVDPVMSSEDAREGARAFAERRPPRWHGR
jgi:enoyl-CoA hydratase